MSDKGKKKHRISKRMAWSALVTFFGVIPCWIFVGGIDCAPPDDSDLLLPQSDEPYTDEENGWTILSNVLSQVEKISNSWMYDGTNTDQRVDAWNLANGKLCFYANPESSWFDHDEIMPDVLSHFTNRTTSAAYVESLLKSNEWLFAGIDAALAAPRYLPPPIVPVASPYDDQPCMPITEILQVNRSFLLSRVKCNIDKGDYDAAAEYYKKNLRLATLLQTRCGSFVEYLAGVAMLEEDVSLLERELDDSAIPAEKLKVFDNLLKDLPGLSPEAFAHALKWEYFYAKEGLRFKPVEVVFPGKSDFAKLLLTPIARYALHPNRCLCVAAERIRNAIQYDVLPCEEGICWRRKLGWIGVLIPNCYENVGLSRYRAHHKERVKRLSEDVASVRRKISERIIAQQTNAEYVVGSQWFPLVFTNGCYYTHDMKKIIAFSPETKSIVVSGDVKLPNIMSSDDFDNLRTIVVPRGCETCLEEWDFVFRAPVDLKEVVVAEAHPEIGISGGVLYDRKTMRLLNLVGDMKTIVMPKGVIVDRKNWPRNSSLRAKGVERLHFCGPLPDFRSRSDSFARRLERWWEYKSWENFKRIVLRPHREGMLSHASSNLVVTVSHENADERTKSIVESGLWEGRRISWGEP